MQGPWWSVQSQLIFWRFLMVSLDFLTPTMLPSPLPQDSMHSTQCFATAHHICVCQVLHGACLVVIMADACKESSSVLLGIISLCFCPGVFGSILGLQAVQPLVSGPLGSVMGGIPCCGMGLKMNQILVGQSRDFFTTLTPVHHAGNTNCRPKVFWPYRSSDHSIRSFVIGDSQFRLHISHCQKY